MSQYANFTEVMDTFAKYDNLAGFFVANEVIPLSPAVIWEVDVLQAVTNPAGIDASPYVKAAVRDTKAYMDTMVSKGGRYIPIGYSAADIATIRPMFQDYLACGSTSVAIDFFAVNIYEWVSHSTLLTPNFSSAETKHSRPQVTLTVLRNCKATPSQPSSPRTDVSPSVLAHSVTCSPSSPPT